MVGRYVCILLSIGLVVHYTGASVLARCDI